jgi:hyperosmotically inducible protein
MRISKTLLPVLVVSIALAGCAVLSDRETAGEYVDDVTLTTKAKSAIIQEPKLKGLEIHVESFQGEVQLSGFVDSLAEKVKAEEVIKGLGAKSVKNSLVVRKIRKR